jgi:hypothetical protein
MVGRAISDLVSSGPGSLMVKLDLESACCHIPVRRANWHLLGFTWDNKYFYDLALGFGCRSSHLPDIVEKALEWSLALGKQLGLRFQPLKVVGPATQLDFLGLDLDSVVMEVHLPTEKLTYLLDLLTSWSQGTHCRLHKL